MPQARSPSTPYQTARVTITKEHWDELNEMTLEVGHGLSMWAGVETQLAQIFSVVLESPSPVAFPILGAVINFRDRMAMIDATANVFLPPKSNERKQWGHLYDRCLTLSKTRNIYAHWIPFLAVTDLKKNDVQKVRKAVLGPPHGHPDHPTSYRQALSKCWTIKQLRHSTSEFDQLGSDLYEFYQHLVRRTRRRREAVARAAGRHPRFDGPGARTPKAPSTQRQPSQE